LDLSLSHTTAPTHTHTLSLHDALPISWPINVEQLAAGKLLNRKRAARDRAGHVGLSECAHRNIERPERHPHGHRSPGGAEKLAPDRKSTRLNSSHSQISYAVFCLKKKK